MDRWLGGGGGGVSLYIYIYIYIFQNYISFSYFTANIGGLTE